MKNTVALITDFGLKDSYVGSLKGVLLQSNPDIRVVDITHGVRPFDVVDAAFKLKCSFRYFPSGTVFLIGVDPNPEDEPIIVSTERYYIVCPNNGVASLMLEEEPPESVHLITASHYFLEGPGNFRARNILAPIAANLSNFQSPQYLGDEVEVSALKLFRIPSPRREGNGYECIVLDVDSFGNLILNLRYSGTNPKGAFIDGREIARFSEDFRNLQEGELFISVNPEGYFQIVAFKGSASRQLKVGRGKSVRLEF